MLVELIANKEVSLKLVEIALKCHDEDNKATGMMKGEGAGSKL